MYSAGSTRTGSIICKFCPSDNTFSIDLVPSPLICDHSAGAETLAILPVTNAAGKVKSLSTTMYILR